jgi:26S proteasome regulatory subunit N5
VHVREWLIQLSKRRAQSKKATTDMVQLCMNTFMSQLPSREDRFTMLNTMRTATEGKIFLEREYAQSTRDLVEMYEADGKIDEAAAIIQEIQIETYGSLENKEKVSFILYQMKLVLARQDYIRTQILSRKISKRGISEKGLEHLKIQYYGYMVRYYIHEKESMETCRSYQTIYDTINKADDETKTALDASGNARKSAFQNFVLYLLLSPYT